jgi:hypothetical protein
MRIRRSTTTEPAFRGLSSRGMVLAAGVVLLLTFGSLAMPQHSGSGGPIGLVLGVSPVGPTTGPGTAAPGAVNANDPPQATAASAGQKYVVWFNESGVPNKVVWQVYLNSTDGGSHGHMIGEAHSFEFSVANDSYSYNVSLAPANTSYSIAVGGGGPTGNVTVAGQNTSFSVVVGLVVYQVRVTEKGLASGTSWTAIVGGVSKHTTGTGINFQLPNSTYSYSIPSVSGYSVTPVSGHVTVSGSNRNVAVVFTADPAGHGLLSKYWWAIAIGGVVLVAILVLLVVRWKRSRAPPSEWVPPEQQAMPPPAPPAGPPPPPAAGGPVA